MSKFTTFGETLKAWRHRRQLSQLDLALEANVSTRHISYLETGRARPSREMVLLLAGTLSLPLRARNELLEHAGFTREFPEAGLDAGALEAVRSALKRMLASQMPLPALVCDRHWTLVDANASAQALLAPLHGTQKEINMIRMLATNPLARQMLENWHDVMEDMAARLRLEITRSNGDPVLRELLDLVRAQAEPTETTAESVSGPFTPVIIRFGGHRLSLLSMLAEFGTPRDITISDLRIELFFPGDAATETFFNGAAS